MIDLQKLIAECDFHLKRGDNMVMDPQDVKDLAAAAKPEPEVQALVESVWLEYTDSVKRKWTFRREHVENAILATIAKHGGS